MRATGGYGRGGRSRRAGDASLLLRQHAVLPARRSAQPYSVMRIVLVALALLVAGCAQLAPKPLPPRVALDTVRIIRFTGSEARFLLKLIVQNPNPFELAVTAFDATLAVEGEAVLTGALVAPVVLAAGLATPIEVEARAGLRAVTGVLDRFSRQRAVRYEVTGSAVVQDGWRLPFSKAGELPVGELLGPKR